MMRGTFNLDDLVRIGGRDELQSMFEPELHEGDAVRLNSGGPRMTIGRVVGEWAMCSWTVELLGRPALVAYSFKIVCLHRVCAGQPS